MSIMKDLLNLIHTNKTKAIIKNKNGFQDLSRAKIANQMENIEYHFHNEDFQQLRNEFESVIDDESSVALKEVLIPIEKLISEGKPRFVINKFLDLIDSKNFSSYSKDEKFLIYNGLLNCYVNIDADEIVIDKWSVKIESLGEGIKEKHRFYFIKAIWKYNLGDYKIAKILNNQAIKIKPDYMNAVVCDYLIRTSNHELAYEVSKNALIDLLKKPDLKVKDLSTIYSFLGDIAFNNQDYLFAKESYMESNNYEHSLTKDIGFAVATYFTSIKKLKENYSVDLEDIDYTILLESVSMFEKIYDARTEDTIHTISRFVLPYLFNAYILSNNHNKILVVVEEVNEFLDYSKEDIARHVVQAQVLNKIYDPDTFRYLNDYDKLKYEAFYFEGVEEYERELQLVLPALEDKYPDDKLLQLSLLNSLKELDRYEDYMHYYKKFSRPATDEVFWMNYIQFMHDKGKREIVISELRKIKDVASNAIVLYDLLILLLEYDLTEELDDFFLKLDKGEHKLIDLQMSFVKYYKLIHLLKNDRFEDFYSGYESLALDELRPIDRLILTVNYYTFKGDLSESAKAYYELFKVNNNHNDLLKAVEMKMRCNAMPDAFYYIEFLNPMELDKPEFYYMYYAILLKEKGKVDEAFDKLEEYKEFVQDDLESAFHQFYTGFAMTNGRINEAFIYMVEYNAKNPNPSWFKAIQHSPEDTGEVLLKKIEGIVGKKEDLSQLNWFFNSGVIGVSVYEKLTGTKIEQMLYDSRYPFTKLNVCIGDVRKAIAESKKINNRIIIDVNAMIVLAKAEGLSLLDAFDEVLISYNSLTILKKKETDFIKNVSTDILKYIEESLRVIVVPVDVSLKMKGSATKLLPEDTLNCIALSEEMKVPFLNVEVSIYREFKPNNVIDLNGLFFYFKEQKPDLLENVARVKKNLRILKFDFISFNADDIVSIYKTDGLEGIKAFIKMSKNSDYISFVQAYIPALEEIRKLVSQDEFDSIASYFIQYFDKYLGKTRYYMLNITRNYTSFRGEFEFLIQNCNIVNILTIHHKAGISLFNASEYLDILNSNEFMKILNIAGAVARFIIMFLSSFGKTKDDLDYYISLIKDNLVINNIDDINYIVRLFEADRDKIQTEE